MSHVLVNERFGVEYFLVTPHIKTCVRFDELKVRQVCKPVEFKFVGLSLLVGLEDILCIVSENVESILRLVEVHGYKIVAHPPLVQL